MAEVALVVALVLLVAAVPGSVLPVLPAGLLSLAGLAVYALFGAERIGMLWLASMLLVGAVAATLELLAGPAAARASGASLGTTLVAAVGGAVLFLVAGPVGILLGMAAGVFLVEVVDGTSPRVAIRRSAVTVLGLLGASALQAVLTAAILLAFVVAVL